MLGGLLFSFFYATKSKIAHHKNYHFMLLRADEEERDRQRKREREREGG